MTDNAKLLSAVICIILFFIYLCVVVKVSKNKEINSNGIFSITLAEIIVGLITSLFYFVVYVFSSRIYLMCVKHTEQFKLIDFTVSGRAILIIGFLSLFAILYILSDNIKDVIGTMFFKDAFLPMIYKNQFIYSRDYLETSIDGVMIKDPIAIKKLAIINKDLIPKLDKMDKLFDKLEETKNHDNDTYKEQRMRLFDDMCLVKNKITNLCKEIIEIENKNKVDPISKQIDEIEKTL